MITFIIMYLPEDCVHAHTQTHIHTHTHTPSIKNLGNKEKKLSFILD